MFRRRVSVDPTPEQEREYFKLLYDLTEHAATLCTATAAVLVALSCDDPSRLYVPLGILLGALLLIILLLLGGFPCLLLLLAPSSSTSAHHQERKHQYKKPYGREPSDITMSRQAITSGSPYW